MEIENIDEILDKDWINEFEELDKQYQIFYTDDLYYIPLVCIYVNKENNIVKTTEDKVFMNNPNQLTREEVLGLLKRYSLQNEIRYSVLSILKYNIDMDPTDIKFFLKSKKGDDAFNFLTSIKNIDAISFKKTISMFHDLNTLSIIFYEKEHNSSTIARTKKIYLRSLNSHKNTIRKRA